MSLFLLCCEPQSVSCVEAGSPCSFSLGLCGRSLDSAWTYFSPCRTHSLNIFRSIRDYTNFWALGGCIPALNDQYLYSVRPVDHWHYSPVLL